VPDCLDDGSGQSVIAMGWNYPRRDELKTKSTVFLGLVRFSTLPVTKCYTEDEKEVYQDFRLCAQKKCGDFCTVNNVINPNQATPCGRSKCVINYFVLYK